MARYRLRVRSSPRSAEDDSGLLDVAVELLDEVLGSELRFTPQATEDLNAIWWFIAEDNREAADRVEMEIVATCRRLAKRPLMGTKRQAITHLQVRFWTVTRFPNYVVVYRPETVPLQVVAVLHGKRDLKKALECRSFEPAGPDSPGGPSYFKNPGLAFTSAIC